MLRLVYLGLVLLVATPAWSQLQATPFETPETPTDESRMLTPPPVSAQAYPAIVGSQMRSNFLGAGLIFTTAYNDNVLAGDGTNPVGDVVYSILPTISLDQTTPRQHLTLIYSPGFTFYQHTTSLNAAAQSAPLVSSTGSANTRPSPERFLSKKFECVQPALPSRGSGQYLVRRRLHQGK